MSPGRQLAAVLLLLSYALVGRQAVAVWESELTLWAQARAMAPHKYRPSINYVKALYGLGREGEAQRILDALP